jgi:hypothetical protein
MKMKARKPVTSIAKSGKQSKPTASKRVSPSSESTSFNPFRAAIDVIVESIGRDPGECAQAFRDVDILYPKAGDVEFTILVAAELLSKGGGK